MLAMIPTLSRPRARLRPLIFLGLLLLPGWCAAQISLDLSVENYRFLQLESVPLTLTVQNNTSQAITLGAGNAGFFVEQRTGQLMSRLPGSAQWEGFEIPPRSRRSLELRLETQYDLRRTGPYVLQAWADVGGRRVRSRRTFIHIVPGLEVSSLEYGEAQETEGHRTFELRSLNRKQRERLMLRIMDPRNHLCYGVFDLGIFVRSLPPEMRVDDQENFHVLHQSGSERFVHHVFSFDGERVDRSSYSRLLGPPVLTPQTDGTLRVTQEVQETETGPRAPRRVDTLLPDPPDEN